MTITKINTDREDRVETGALKINNDWKGLFIRGDWCLELMLILEGVLDGRELNIFEKNIITEYIRIIDEDVLK